jgi:hypothetical protein
MDSADERRRKDVEEEWRADTERNKRIATICRIKIGTACLSSYVDEKLLERLQQRTDEVFKKEIEKCTRPERI